MMNRPHNHHHIYDLCHKHMNKYVLAELADGSKVDGIITGLDNENVHMAVPLEAHEMYPDYGDYRFGPVGYPYGYGYGYGYPPNRFRRLILPLAALATISALPWY
ncbi:hypothetical protein [Radiobacillus kanasensis]|uniref:hypothetical protein n=1 Tax=Radiobacillus kanasensis TaxID=2844358 RepID=UPI002ED7E391